MKLKDISSKFDIPYGTLRKWVEWDNKETLERQNPLENGVLKSTKREILLDNPNIRNVVPKREDVVPKKEKIKEASKRSKI